MVSATKFTTCLIEHAVYRNSRYCYFDKGYCMSFCLIAFAKTARSFQSSSHLRYARQKVHVIVKWSSMLRFVYIQKAQKFLITFIFSIAYILTFNYQVVLFQQVILAETLLQ